MSMEATKPEQKSYHIFTAGVWYIPLLLVLYLPSFIGFWFVADMMEGMDEWMIKATAIIMLILTYPIAHYIARKYTQRPLRIRFDDQEIRVDTFSRDLQTLEKSAVCQLNDIANFEDTDLTDNKFQLELTNGEVFRIQPVTRWWGSDEEFEALVRDFKAHVKTLNPDGTKSTIAYRRKWFTGTIGKVLLFLAVGGVLASVGLFIAGWLKQGGFNWDLVKLPLFMLIFSLGYIINYYSDRDNDDE